MQQNLESYVSLLPHKSSYAQYTKREGNHVDLHKLMDF